MSAALLVALTCAAGAADDTPPPLPVGSPLPLQDLYDLQGRRVRLQDVRQPVIVLNFWAFWCDTWIAELSQLRELAGQERRLGFKLFAISIDGKWTDQLQAVCGGDPPPFPVLVDRNSRLSGKLGLRRIPTVIVLDPQRRISTLFEAYPGNPSILEAIRNAGSEGKVEIPDQPMP